jgi:hypothetical protein
VIEAAISGAASRRQAARRTVVAVALLVAAVPCLVLLWLPARFKGDGSGSTTASAVATVPQTPAAVRSPLPMLAAGFNLSNHSRSLVRDRLAREIERASGGLLTVAGPPAPSTRRPVPAWNDPRHVITAISHPDEIPLLIAKLSREALGSRFGDGER